MQGKGLEGIKIFYCYAREDKTLREQLGRHLELLRQKDFIMTFYDVEMLPGANLKEEIENILSISDIILVLVSAYFIGPNYYYNFVLQKALEMVKAGKIRIIPVILRPCAWEVTPLGQIQALPTDGKPVTSWNDLDGAFYDIFKGINKVVEELNNANRPLRYEFDSIYRQKDRITEILFSGRNISNQFFNFLESLLPTTQFYSCFISYSSKDQLFAEKLYNDLQRRGVQCWFAPNELLPGTRILDAITEAISSYDRVLLVLSSQTARSSWVTREIEAAFYMEATRKQVVIFPIRLDNTRLEGEANMWFRNRHIGDFTLWQDENTYQKALEILLNSLKKN